ncbi:MAG: hypothetical protein ACR2G4_08435 [Pyrinomonadaceae bacterium]
MTGALAIGSCVVLDCAPLTEWPQPLLAGVNYLSLGAETGPEQALATEEQYASIPDKIGAWLANAETIAEIGRNNGAYFDRFLDPIQVGARIMQQIESPEKKDVVQHAQGHGEANSAKVTMPVPVKNFVIEGSE